MSIVTVTDKYNLTITYFDGQDQLVPFSGFTVDGMAPYVPEDEGPGWVCFEMPVHPKAPREIYFLVLQNLARRLFCDLGFTADQVIALLEDF